jgi:putative hydrolase of the HAD superfamily
VNDRYLTRLSEIAILEENAYPVIETLFRKGFLLGLLSNGVKRVQERRVELSGLKPFFKHVLTSEEAGVGKPHPVIFRMMLERFGDQIGKAIYIGDSWEVDIIGAENAGLIPIWYHKNELLEPVKKTNVCTFSNWNQFIPLLSEQY